MYVLGVYIFIVMVMGINCYVIFNSAGKECGWNFIGQSLKVIIAISYADFLVFIGSFELTKEEEEFD